MAVTINGTNGVTFNNNSTSTVGGLGDGQVWTNVLSSRALATTYTNSTGKPIQLYISVNGSGAAGNWGTLTIGGVDVGWVGGYGTTYYSASAIVPAGATYSLTSVGGGGITIVKWTELR